MTRAVIIAAVTGLVAWDIFAAVRPHDDHQTITREIRLASRRAPVIPFALGYLMGHLTWSEVKDSG